MPFANAGDRIVFAGLESADWERFALDYDGLTDISEPVRRLLEAAFGIKITEEHGFPERQ